MELFLVVLVLVNTAFNLFVLIDTRRVEKIAVEARKKADFCMYVISKKHTEEK